MTLDEYVSLTQRIEDRMIERHGSHNVKLYGRVRYFAKASDAEYMRSLAASKIAQAINRRRDREARRRLAVACYRCGQPIVDGTAGQLTVATGGGVRPVCSVACLTAGRAESTPRSGQHTSRDMFGRKRKVAR